jgi:hypothetical protein
MAAGPSKKTGDFGSAVRRFGACPGEARGPSGPASCAGARRCPAARPSVAFLGGAAAIRSRGGVAPPREPGNVTRAGARDDGFVGKGDTTMKATVAANDSHLRPVREAGVMDELGLTVPHGHVGPVLLSATGRTVWWTGRVAIGLRYEPAPRTGPCGQSAQWIQDLLLECA